MQLEENTFWNNITTMLTLRALLQSERAIQLTNAVIMVLAAWMLVTFVWSFWPQQDAVSLSGPGPLKQTNREFNISKVIASELFGSTTQAPVQTQQITAPVTRLKLKLRGIFESDDEFASAMIEHSNKQEVYRLDSKLPGAANLTLYKVLSDRIIMSRAGKYETLYIEDFDGTAKATVIERREPTTLRPETTDDDRNIIDKRKDSRVSEEIVKLREKLTDPQAINEFIAVSPVMDDGEFQGFRVAPGKDRALFGRVGLRRNDIITEVNGITMDNPAAGFSIFEQMTTADEINISLKRGNRDITILLSAAGTE